MRLVNYFSKSLLSTGLLGHRMITGAVWTSGSFIYRYALRLLSTIIVTRLLMPEAYGLMSIAMVFITGLSLFSDIGIAPTVIQSKRGDNEEFLQTAWSIKIVRGLILGLIGIAIAWPAAQIYNQPELFSLICALSMMPIIEGFMSISELTCRRHLKLKAINIIESISATLTTGLTIFFAWQLKSVWAFVIGSIGGAVIKTIFTYLFLRPFSHKLNWNRADVIEILTFGGWILLATIATFFSIPGLVLIQGLLVSVSVMGFITLANTLAWAMGELISMVLSSVFFPSMSEIARERPKELRAKIYKITTILYYGLLPFFLVLALVSNTLIDILYDDRYAIVGDFLAIMSITGALMIMVMPYSSVMLAKGDARVHFLLVATAAMLRITSMIAGFYIWDVFGMLIGIGIGVVFYNICVIYMAERHEIGNLKRDTLMLILWSLIFLVISYYVISTTGNEGLL